MRSLRLARQSVDDEKAEIAIDDELNSESTQRSGYISFVLSVWRTHPDDDASDKC